MSLTVQVRCITCKAVKTIDQQEAERLTAARSIPMCDRCSMPMVAISASNIRKARAALGGGHG